MSTELTYLLLLFALFVVPKALQRFRVPAAVTSFLLGAVSVHAGLFGGDVALGLLATLGISGLFLFAGLDVEVRDLRRGASFVAQHVALQAALVAGTAAGLAWLLGIPWRASTLVALALLTPSTGFILDSLPSFGLDPAQAFWTRTKAVATEIVALAVLFVVLQSTSPLRLGLTSLALLALVVVIPVLMRVFAGAIAPYAPRSEFAFLVMLAVLAAYVTRALGVYYLVGAFLVGIAARQFRRELPALSSDRLIHAVEVFASFFAPFYFFSAGAHVRAEMVGPKGLLMGLAFVVVFVPLRVGIVALHRRVALGEAFGRGRRVATSLVPTLVFALVLAEILASRFVVPPWLVGGIVVYALVTTLLPSLALGIAPAFDAPHADAVEPPDGTPDVAPPAPAAGEGGPAPAPDAVAAHAGQPRSGAGA